MRALTLTLVLLLPAALGVQSAENDGKSALATRLLEASGLKKGLVAHIGVSDGRLTAALGANGNFLVHGLAYDANTVAKARKHIQGLKLYGRVSVERGSTEQLPYADNTVNVVIVDDLPGLLRKAPGLLKEIVRVLTPRGVALLGKGADGQKLEALGLKGLRPLKPPGNWARVEKPWPKEMDEWTHEFHGPDGNAVSADTAAGVPNHLRWINGPVFAVFKMGSMGTTVSARGRVFMFWNGQPVAPDNMKRHLTAVHSRVLAYDAFNGLLLWERRADGTLKGVPHRPPMWATGDHAIGSLVPMAAVGNRVFVALGGKLLALDAATGKTVKDYGAMQPIEIVVTEGKLIASTLAGLQAFDVQTGRSLWKYKGLARNLVVSGGRTCFLAPRRGKSPQVAALDLGTGRELWVKDLPGASQGQLLRAKLHLASGDKLLVSVGKYYHGRLLALSGKTGKVLWQYEDSQVDPKERKKAFCILSVFIINGFLHVHQAANKGYGNDFVRILNLADGKRKDADEKLRPRFRRHSCQPFVATPRFMSSVMQFLDVKTGKLSIYNGARSGCRVGIRPANGLFYTQPHACACHPDQLFGFMGHGSLPAADFDPAGDKSPRLVKGTAGPAPGAGNAADWPTYRHDARRTGYTPNAVSAKLSPLWKADLGGEAAASFAKDWAHHPEISGAVSSPVVAGGLAYVALPNRHAVVALDAGTGKTKWTYTAAGRVDSPPTIAKGYCVFGSRGGWVYSLNARSGKLAWRFRAAPRDRRVMAFGQLESSWPVAGSVLVQDEKVFLAAGRVTAVDGGVHAHVLDLRSGKVLWSGRKPKSRTRASVLIGDGQAVYMGTRFLDPLSSKKSSYRRPRGKQLLAASFGLLDNSWTRGDIAMRRGILSQWSYGRGIKAQMLVRGDRKIFGYRQGPRFQQVFLAGVSKESVLFAQNNPETTGSKGPGSSAWSVKVPKAAQVEAMLLAGDRLFAAGRLSQPKGTDGGFIREVSTKDGKKIWEHELPTPVVYDGMAAAAGRLYVSARDGKVHCFGTKP